MHEPERQEGPGTAGAVGESFRIKMVQTLTRVPYDVRGAALREAGYNVLRLPRDRVYLDFATARGNAGLTDRQLSALMIGDEAYAGSRNFEALERVCRAVFGKRFVVPTHQGRGAEHLILRGLLQPGQAVATNGNLWTLRGLAAALGLHVETLLKSEAFDAASRDPSKADFPLDRLEKRVASGEVGLVIAGAALPQLGGQPLSLANLRAAAELARGHGVLFALDASMVASAAYLDRAARGSAERVADLIRQYAEACDLLYLSGREDAGCHTGGLIATDREDLYVLLRGLVVVYEGLHTYGGQAGRDMQALAQGIEDLKDESYLDFRTRKLAFLFRHLAAAGLPVVGPVGLSGVCLDCRGTALCGWREHGTTPHAAANLAALLYLVSGVRARPLDAAVFGRDCEWLGLFVPRRCYTERQLDYLIASCAQLMRHRIAHPLRRLGPAPEAPELARYEAEGPFLTEYHGDPVPPATPEPYFIKVVEPFRRVGEAERARAIREAGYNTFLLRSEDVYIDLLTDSGTAAMSNEQWARMIEAQESELGGEASRAFVERARAVLGFRHVLPVHQGRAAEHLLSQALIRPGQFVVNNMYFTTTREHQERAGGIFVDLIVDEAYDPRADHPFKGDLDPTKLRDFIAAKGADAIAYVCVETNVNMAGGQPVSLGVTREVSAICRYHGIPLIFDATRLAENAYFIKTREPGYADWSIKDIIRELMALGDGCTVSAKKDVLVNIGGILAVNDPALSERCAALCATFEGTPWSGGLAARDLAAMAVGLEEMTDADYLASRVEQVRYLWERLREGGVPVVAPAGGHAVFLDAQAFLPHVPQEEFPAQRLAAALYEASGVRGMERGLVSAGRDPVTGRHRHSALELVRLTIPRRVYTYSHMDVVADGVLRVFRHRERLAGLKLTYEPPTLRFFTARFELL
jgi:tyrosine phenol-lyase